MSRPIPPETFAWLHHAAAAGQADARLMLTMLERIEALEQRPIAGTVELAAPTPEAVPMATDDQLRLVADAHCLWSDSRRAIYILGREHGATAARCPHVRTSDEGSAWCELAEQTAAAPPAPPAAPAPAGGLVDRVADAIVTKATSAGIVDDRPARAAIREVAAWLDSKGQHGCSLWLREEADR